ncbi:MAG TPA: hypothetical protein GX512_03390 [Firmicutes bacterium]|nr:hypothetical protein [Candidatus Fermentithermobacillaceae bacterium]
MMVKDFVVTLSPEEAASAIIEALVSHEEPVFYLLEHPVMLVDNHRIQCSSGVIITLVLAKWFVRTGDYVNVVVVLSNLTGGSTTVHLCTGRFRRWFRDVDFGAAKTMVGMVESVLERYKLD